MDSMTLQQVEKMGLSEKRWLPERLKAPIAEETAGPAPRGTPDRCPRCGSADFCRRGHDAHGLQRWRCKSCGRAFSAKTGSALAMSELDATTWAAYAEGALAGMSLREPADSCSVCLRTPRSMGMRLFEAMGSAPAPFRILRLMPGGRAHARLLRHLPRGFPSCDALLDDQPAIPVHAPSPASLSHCRLLSRRILRHSADDAGREGAGRGIVPAGPPDALHRIWLQDRMQRLLLFGIQFTRDKERRAFGAGVHAMPAHQRENVLPRQRKAATRRTFLIAVAALAIVEFSLIWSSSRTSGVSGYIPPTIIVAGTVEDAGSVPGISVADGEPAYIELKVADIQADSVAEMQAAEDGSSLPEGGDILTLIRSGSTARAYGPEPEIGDEVEAEALFCKKDAVIVGEHRTAYSLWHIETYDWLIETGQRSHYPEIPRPASEAE